MSDTVQDFVKKNIHMVTADENVIEIFNIMKRNKVRHVPVVEDGKAIGIVSDRDVQFVKITGNSFDLKAKDIMTPEPYTVDSMMSIAHVVNIMAQKKFSSVLIHDKSEKVIGIFTSTDALNILSEHYKKQNL